MKELFITNVGSHMWQMDHPGSDIDLFIAVLAPTNAILRGEINPDVSWVNYTGPKDQNYHELGRIVQQALKGNWNYLSGVMSPIVLKDWEHLAELRRLTERNYSKQCYYSIKGLAEHNYRKYVINERDDSEKRCNTIARTVLMGCRLLEKGLIEYTPVKGTKPQDIPILIQALDSAYKESKLPENPQHEDELRSFLLKRRVEDLDETQK